MQAVAPIRDPFQRRIGPFRTAALYALLMLVAQFLLGMWINLFVTIPGHHPGRSKSSSQYLSHAVTSDRWALQHASVVLRAHVILGLLLGIGALYTIVMGVRAHRGGLLTWSIVGAIGALVAGIQGASFLVFNDNASSMIMAGGFALAVISYSVSLYLAR